ncbi:dephospho-CoA kinase [Glaciibacter superstes]|uniref:dephospho-CoA kinase n=1 Tax=Glaciibacter superstes TaxID=501023 RepID=UPI0003B580A5|nr:dephospho-CoA kinase [Glaciibacter superstes]
MYLIGLTGGIASGKSTVAKRLAARGAVHIDADRLAREVVEPGMPALETVRREFGEAVIREDGSLDRAALGAKVFGDSDALARLNAIVHPAVKERTAALLQDAASSDPHAIVVYDVPLLVEATGTLDYDLIVVVHASEATRIRRMTSLRGMSEEDAVRRIRAQAADEERLAVADVVIDTDGTMEATERQVDELFQRVVTEAGRPSVSGSL